MQGFRGVLRKVFRNNDLHVKYSGIRGYARSEEPDFAPPATFVCACPGGATVAPISLFFKELIVLGALCAVIP